MERSKQSYQRIQIGELPVAANVCQQELREVWQSSQKEISLAHVIMEPDADSLLHKHLIMTEVYHILDGEGTLTVGEEEIPVAPGTVVEIFPNVAHKLKNGQEKPLTHLVFALPAFDPTDVYLLENER